MAQQVICPYCHKPCELKTSEEFYGVNYGSYVWSCKPCDAYVGTHKGKTKPLGFPADSETRRWRQKAHNMVDPLWKSGKASRTDVYKWMSKVLSLPKGLTHIGMFDIPKCKRIIKAVRKLEKVKIDFIDNETGDVYGTSIIPMDYIRKLNVGDLIDFKGIGSMFGLCEIQSFAVNEGFPEGHIRLLQIRSKAKIKLQQINEAALNKQFPF